VLTRKINKLSRISVWMTLVVFLMALQVHLIDICNHCSVCVDGGRSVDIQYSNWANGYPHENDRDCVIATQHNQWVTWYCNEQQRYVCQSKWEFITYLNSVGNRLRKQTEYGSNYPWILKSDTLAYPRALQTTTRQHRTHRRTYCRTMKLIFISDVVPC